MLTSPNTLGDHSDKVSIALRPPFSSTPTGTQSARFFIDAPDCQQLATAPSNSKNFVVTYVPRIAGITNPADPTLSSCNVMTTIQYFDGLGRPIQTVQVKGSTMGNDFVQPISYDQYGRVTRKYLPYAIPSSANSDGSFKPNAIVDQQDFYAPTGSTGTQQSNGIARITTPFAPIAFEPSPLNRSIEEGAPGDAWQLTGTAGLSATPGHTVKTSYGSNAANEVNLWLANNTGASWNNNYYNAGDLYKTITTDENGNNSIKFIDKLGQIICKKAQLGSIYLATYYIYDDFHNLAYVVPPIPAAITYPNSFTETDDIFKWYIYAYHYDFRNRLAEKKLPGKGWEHLVYNNIDQVVATQDAVQRPNNKYTFTKYDGQGRVIMTGEITDTRGHQQITDALATQTVNWEVPNNGYTDGYTTSSSWPNSWNLLYTVNYYDNYTFPGSSTAGYASTATGVATNVRGLLTGHKVRNLISNAMLLSTIYYDDKGQLLEAIAQNNIGGTDRIVNQYNFTGQLTQKIRTHNSSRSSGSLTNFVISNQYLYDHLGRKTQTKQQTGSGGDWVVLNQLDYSETGQLFIKHLHKPAGGSTFFQDVKYIYNERGWLQGSSAPLFATQLKYNDADDGAAAQYNGNIGNQYWGTPGNLSKHYSYNYDQLNRLVSGISNNGFREQGPTSQGIEYDYLGNIQKLQRVDGLTTTTANYTYSYVGNQLQTITNLTGSTYHYDANGNADHDGHTGRDITYNYLNLPQTVNAGSNTITYTYTAEGQKLKRVSSTSGVGTTDYDNGIVYDNGTTFAQTEDGRVLNLGGTINYEYNLSDHLSNTRVTFDTSLGYARPVQTNDYFPFGMQHTMATSLASPPNTYLYNKKELQLELGQYDYGARFYDPVIARWTAIDPLAEINRRFSPYNYVENNPMRNIDPDGMASSPTINPDDVAFRVEGEAVQAFYQQLLQLQQKKPGNDGDEKCCVTSRDNTKVAKRHGKQKKIQDPNAPYIIMNGKKVYLARIPTGITNDLSTSTYTEVRTLNKGEAIAYLQGEINGFSDMSNSVYNWGMTSAYWVAGIKFLNTAQTGVLTLSQMIGSHNVANEVAELQKTLNLVNSGASGVVEITTITTYTPTREGQATYRVLVSDYYMLKGEYVSTVTSNDR